ncbi:MAG TPA: hypothetical protein VFK40_12650 [Nitrososphaeraceae archaeon]|nr:hypothetical protein [Nitrososphaeraceae archaeon]
MRNLKQQIRLFKMWGQSAKQTGESMQKNANQTGEAIQGNASKAGENLTEVLNNLALK